MTGSTQRRRSNVALVEPLDPALLEDPIEFLVTEHYRQRAVLNLIDHLARGRLGAAIRRRIAKSVLGFLRDDLARHVADEEHDLFPLLRKRARASDSVEAMLDHLAGEHLADERAASELIVRLRHLLAHGSAGPSVALRLAAHAFAQTQRRHLAWENAIIVPFLRRRLTQSDLRALARRMAARRGWKPPRVRRGGRLFAAAAAGPA